MIDHPIEMHNNRITISDEQKNKMFADAMKPIVVSNLDEIKMIINHFLEGKRQLPPVTIKAALEWHDDENKDYKQDVSVNSSSVSLYDLVMNGLDIVKKRIESFSKIQEAVENAKKLNDDIPNTDVWNTENMKFNVDYLIERRMGAKRNGLRIRWKIPVGVFEYDPYLNKLYQMEEDDANKSDTKPSSQ